MPTTRSGCVAAAAIAVTGSEEVFVASTHSLADDLRQPGVELVLEIEALRHRLDHELARREGAQIGDRLQAFGGGLGLGGVDPPARRFFLQACAGPLRPRSSACSSGS